MRSLFVRARLGMACTMIALLSSCMTIKHDYDGPKQITLGTKLMKPSKSVGNIEGGKKAFFLFFGLFRLNDPSGPRIAEDVATRQFGKTGYDGVTRMRIDEEMDVLDVIVSTITLNLFSMSSVQVEGQVHKFTTSGGSQ